MEAMYRLGEDFLVGWQMPRAGAVNFVEASTSSSCKLESSGIGSIVVYRAATVLLLKWEGSSVQLGVAQQEAWESQESHFWRRVGFAHHIAGS